MAVKEQKITEQYAIYNGDCIEVMKGLPDGKIHASIYSPPFGGLYNYSSNERDLSNCADYGEFFSHYEYVVKELFRLTVAGRCSAVHCTDVPSSNNGVDHLTDFPGDIIRLHERLGWRFIARHTIWKEPLWVRNRTMCHNLSHKTIVDNGALGGVASADYLLVFRKPGKISEPADHPVGLLDYAGEEPIPADLMKYRGMVGKQTENRYSQWIWRHYASSIWDDIRMHRVLPFQDCKDPDDEKHVHPLQLDVISRFVALRTKPGETVLTPFMGVGSEVYASVELGRRGIGAELKPSYYRQAVANMSALATGGAMIPVSTDHPGQQRLFSEVEGG